MESLSDAAEDRPGVNFKAIASKGKKPMLASFLTSILLMCFAAGVAMLFF